MDLPFDSEQFFAVFADYNAAIWPAQIVAYALGIMATGALLIERPGRDRFVLSILSLLWIWNGLAYHLGAFSEINPAAVGFGLLFIVQAVLFGASALVPDRPRFTRPAGWTAAAAGALLLYSLLIYPILGVIAGHSLMDGPVFGVTPCPTTIFTIALLLLVTGRWGLWLSIIPIVWAAIGTSAAVALGVPQDFGLGIAGTVLIVSLILQKRRAANRSRYY